MHSEVEIISNFIIIAFIICAAIFALVMIIKSRKSEKSGRQIFGMIISIVAAIVAGIIGNTITEKIPTQVVVNDNNNNTSSNKDGYYTYKIFSNKNTDIKIKKNPYIISQKDGKGFAQATFKFPDNIGSTKAYYIGSERGMDSDSDWRPIYNNSDAYKQMQKNKAKEAKEKQDQADAQAAIKAKKQEQKKQSQEAQYKAQYPPIEDKLSNPFNATEEQQAQPYLIRSKVIDMAGYPAGMQYITQDKNGNKYFTFVGRGDLKGGSRANLNDILEIYSNSIFITSINQHEIDSGMENSHVGEKVLSTLPDRVYLKREE